MSTNLPQDSSAQGTIVITAGSSEEQGNIAIFTKGYSQSLETITTSNGTEHFLYSNGFANDSSHAGSKTMDSLELASSSQSALFPLPILIAILSYSDSVYEYVGLENIAGSDCHHIRTYRNFASQPDLIPRFVYRSRYLD